MKDKKKQPTTSISSEHAGDFLDMIFENIPDMIFVKDAEELRFVRFNKAGEELLGFSRSELYGKNDYDFFPKEEADFFTAKDREVLNNGKLLDIPNEPIVTKNKGTRFLHTKKIPVCDANGNPLYLLGISEDITEKVQLQKALRRSEERLNLALQSAGVGTWVWDIKQGIVNWDDYMPPLFGLAEGEFKKSYDHFLELLHPEDRERVALLVSNALSNDDPYDTEFRVFWPRDKSEHVIAARGKVVRDEQGFPRKFVGVCWDVTLRAKTEEALRVAHSELESRVEQRTKQLADANLALTLRNQELDDFSYLASHDLQEPLRKIRMFAELLVEDCGTDLNEAVKKDISVITNAAMRMQELVNDLLELSRAGKSTLEKRQVSLEHCVQDVLSLLSDVISEKGAEIKIDPLPIIEGDITLIRQLYQNLISNALKFSNSSKPLVHITAEEIDRKVVLGVKDNGIGIKSDYLLQIFAPFKRLHTRAEFPGTGIGLAISKKAAERHGGKIWVESEVGKGSHFKFCLG